MVNATVSHILDDPIGSLHDVGEMSQHLTTSPTRSALKTRPMTASAATRLPNVQFGGSSSSDAHQQSNNPRPAANGTNHGSLLMSPGKTAAEGGKANRSTRPQTAGSSRYQVLRAGPTMGGNILETTCKTHPRPKPPPFNNFLVFVVDVEDAERMQAAKTVEEMSEDILDALGLKLPHGKELQAIYAGYEGPERISISSDKDLEGYYNRFASSGNEGDDGDKYDARRDPALTDVIKELEAMRLGGILTKMQMTKYLRLLGDNRMLYLKTVKELQRTRDELYELQEGLPAKIELAVNRAVTKREVELLKQAEQEKGLLLAKCREESQKMLKPLQDAAENSKKALKDIQVQFQKTKSLLSKTETKLAAAEETVRTADARYRDSQEQLHDTERLLQDTRAEREELERALADANEVIDSNGLERPGGSGSSGEDGSGGSGAKNSFSWNIPKIQSKVSWPRERSVCSSDKKLASLSSVVVEFYPGGVEASFPGYCALRLHVPDKTRLSWGVVFGKMKKTHDCGKRSDDFAKHLWWCRNGILWPNVCKLEDVKRNIDRESDSILLTFEAFSVTSLPDEPQRAATLPRPRTASANFASRGQLLMDSGKQRMQLKQNFDKTLVRIFYDSELLTNAWLQDFVAGWLAQKKLAQEAKKDRR